MSFLRYNFNSRDFYICEGGSWVLFDDVSREIESLNYSYEQQKKLIERYSDLVNKYSSLLAEALEDNKKLIESCRSLQNQLTKKDVEQ